MKIKIEFDWGDKTPPLAYTVLNSEIKKAIFKMLYTTNETYKSIDKIGKTLTIKYN